MTIERNFESLLVHFSSLTSFQSSFIQFFGSLLRSSFMAIVVFKSPLISLFRPNSVLFKPILDLLKSLSDQTRHRSVFLNPCSGPVIELSKVSKRQNFCVNVHYCFNSSIVKKRKLFSWKKKEENVISFWFFVKSSIHIQITNGTLSEKRE